MEKPLLRVLLLLSVLWCNHSNSGVQAWSIPSLRLRRQQSPVPNMGYVPDGLTPEEYHKIRQKEQQEHAKKDFGAWGPRFRPQAGPPTGDFMVIPTSLWTTGQVDRTRRGRRTTPNRPHLLRFILHWALVQWVRRQVVLRFMAAATTTTLMVAASSHILSTLVAMGWTTASTRRRQNPKRPWAMGVLVVALYAVSFGCGLWVRN